MNGQEGEIRDELAPPRHHGMCVTLSDRAGSRPMTLEEACPGCGKTDGVARTDSPCGVDTWRCAVCSMSWAVTVVNPLPQLADLGSAVEEIGALRWVLRAVVALAEQAPALADGALRNRLAGRCGAGDPGACPVNWRMSPQQPRPVYDRRRDATGIHLDDGYDPPRNIEQVIAALRALAAEHGVNRSSPQGEGEP